MSARGIAVRPNLARQLCAVIARETRSRFTGDALGYGWAYVTPLAWIGLIYVIFTMFGRVSPIDTDIGSFIISGVLPYLAFRFQVNSAIRAKAAYRQVLVLPELRQGTVYLAVALLELYNTLIIYVVLLAANYTLTGAFQLDNPLKTLFGFALASGSGGALGYAVASLGRRADSLARIMSVVLRPLFYISPVFYTATELPEDVVWLLLWNPLFHAIEILRSGTCLSYQSYVATPWVPIAFIVACVILGRFGETRAQSSAADVPAMTE